ncbi:hypothetical protein SAM23877_p113 (plasmid) [Streptomyces ambofaciens ATCC 23877]|uniref:Uncharacterized protein n=1 Tax=Streptomyces ambofaciens (strain ATCC 23877 / 3486 / DSM 40053 / JCM 4204 / NBRC 12836 / NRRL B-2516) TaxID=278992 RepID=A0A0K2B6W0_STRA7|nr:hypothetical protein [Streptomyces ambofaciens]AKZ60822.1 hypothetical protein SAM23877_p113 [Streptomyces ambofaciens ATCC 23877]
MPDPKRQDDQTAARKQDDSAPTATPAVAPAPAPVEASDHSGRLEPYPGPEFFHGGRYSPVIAAAGARLTREGHNPAGKTLGPDWTTAHRDAWKSFQQELRPKSGGDTSGIPDETAWNRLHVPRVSPLPKES